ncbi:hypothetical protein HPB51_010920 [Rhipicephalus microplus]|uniref:Regulatory protein zeste n=1 Tax=Rhipicephalus microplus TaxID=6941 RepID=A0A9J6D524_RHIMP|nr:hypothetical protein HPB51_010920 [Rhipicephalus microplus]
MPSHRDVGFGPRASESQKEFIIGFMEQHPLLTRRSHVVCPEPLPEFDRRALWRQLAAKLNALGPISKTTPAWRAWWRRQVHEARQLATRGRNYLPRWRLRILDVVGTLPRPVVADAAFEAPENADQVPSMAVEVVLSEESATSEATDPSQVTVPSQGPTLLQARQTSRVSVDTAEGTSGISAPQQKVRRMKHRHARSAHYPNDIVMAAALERLADEAKQQREVAEHQAATLERLAGLHNEQLQELRCIGDVAQSIAIDLQQRTEECG